MSSPQDAEVSEPLTLSLDLACSVEHAFMVWTSRIGSWWPADHTVSGRPESVVLQSGVEGRIFERTPEGVEHDWGRVTTWDPPTRLAYTWHLGRDHREATDVEIRFLARGDALTRIEIEHRGWERLGVEGSRWRDRNRVGWQTLVPHYLDAIAKGDR
jgi:uncharacterized protein YndB with AHSA1/START domain